MQPVTKTSPAPNEGNADVSVALSIFLLHYKTQNVTLQLLRENKD